MKLLNSSLPLNLVAADVSPLHLPLGKVRADSRPLLRFRGSRREILFRGILSTRCWKLAMVAAGVLSLSLVSQAFPPAPYHTIYGLVRDEYGLPLALEDAQIIFTVESTNAANRTEVTDIITPNLEPGVNYRLNLPMDSMTKPDLYKPTALMPAAPFRLRVKIGNTT